MAGRKGGTYPHLWCTGPDPRRHDQYIQWLRHRAQASYRGEAYKLTFDSWCSLWDCGDAWSQRGRKGGDLCLTRIDPEGEWSDTNCSIETRQWVLARARSWW